MNGHDAADPMSLQNKLDAVMEALHVHCDHCSPAVELVPASGARFVLGITHEPACPLAQESQNGVS